ncbi:hypothetical protein C8R47DRAFT_1068103 [Mycena vitilis]|nr:hypothetical protein C8R47DRAFT_1068103 [Mycena vitilis]
MQFSIVALLAIVATVSAGPLRARLATCDLKTCAIDLAPTVTSCATAVADLTAVPFSDAGCVAAAVTQGVDLVGGRRLLPLAMHTDHVSSRLRVPVASTCSLTAKSPPPTPPRMQPALTLPLPLYSAGFECSLKENLKAPSTRGASTEEVFNVIVNPVCIT